MKPQGLYRAEAKKPKPTKLEKTSNYAAKIKKAAEAKKKEAAAV